MPADIEGGESFLKTKIDPMTATKLVTLREECEPPRLPQHFLPSKSLVILVEMLAVVRE